MSRWVKPRYIVVTEAVDGGREAFGPWYDVERAAKVADAIRKQSSRYTEGGPIDLVVSVVALQTWPGIRRYLAGE